MATPAYHYLSIFDGITGRALWLGRTKRIASPTKESCSTPKTAAAHPGCDMPGYLCESTMSTTGPKADPPTSTTSPSPAHPTTNSSAKAGAQPNSPTAKPNGPHHHNSLSQHHQRFSSPRTILRPRTPVPRTRLGKDYPSTHPDRRPGTGQDCGADQANADCWLSPAVGRVKISPGCSSRLPQCGQRPPVELVCIFSRAIVATVSPDRAGVEKLPPLPHR